MPEVHAEPIHAQLVHAVCEMYGCEKRNPAITSLGQSIFHANQQSLGTAQTEFLILSVPHLK